MDSVETQEHSSHNTSKLPKFWDLLTDEDKIGYNNLKAIFDENTFKRNRGHRVETFDDILDTIRKFSERKQPDDWKRFLVCGVCWMKNAIAVNTRQLRLLISKCKSSINGSLQKLGYYTNTSHSESWKILFEIIPLLKDNFTEIRQWTIRYKISLNNIHNCISLPPITCLIHDDNCDLEAKNRIITDDGNKMETIPLIFPIKFRSKFAKLK